MRWIALTLAFAAGLATGQGAPARSDRDAAPRVGVLVDQTRGEDARTVAVARAQVARLERRGVEAELRVARSPSASLGAAAALVTRGAGRLVVYGVRDPGPLAPLREHAAIDFRR